MANDLKCRKHDDMTSPAKLSTLPARGLTADMHPSVPCTSSVLLRTVCVVEYTAQLKEFPAQDFGNEVDAATLDEVRVTVYLPRCRLKPADVRIVESNFKNHPSYLHNST